MLVWVKCLFSVATETIAPYAMQWRMRTLEFTHKIKATKVKTICRKFVGIHSIKPKINLKMGWHRITNMKESLYLCAYLQLIKNSSHLYHLEFSRSLQSDILCTVLTDTHVFQTVNSPVASQFGYSEVHIFPVSRKLAMTQKGGLTGNRLLSSLRV